MLTIGGESQIYACYFSIYVIPSIAAYVAPLFVDTDFNNSIVRDTQCIVHFDLLNKLDTMITAGSRSSYKDDIIHLL